MFIKQIHSIAARPPLVAFIAFGLTGVAAGETAAQLRDFTGSRTRVAWVQDMGTGGDEQCEGKKLRLMGLDTDDGGAERPIIAGISNYYRPLITRGGDRVVYTDWIANKVFVVNWDGSDWHQIASGMAESIWRNPVDGIDWVYVRTGLDKKGQPCSGTSVDRLRIDRPQVRESVWNNRTRPIEDFQVSADGLRAVAAIPWPDAGFVDLAKGTIAYELGNGCWPSMSPDNSYRCWVFDGSHRKVRIYQPGIAKTWYVPVNNHPALSKGEVYHPRWSNDPRFMTVTGPYTKIKNGGPQVDVYVGKFDTEFHSIEKWVRVTNSDRANFYADVWIESASHAPLKAVAGANADGRTMAPTAGKLGSQGEAGGSDTGPIFAWVSGARQGLVKDPNSRQTVPAVPEPRGMVFFGRNRELDLSAKGSFTVNNADEILTSTITRSNQLSIEAIIIPERARERHLSQIITFSSTAKSRNFSLTQDGEHLAFRIRTTETGPNVIKPVLQLCKLQAGRPNHVIVTYQSGRVVCYLNGEMAYDGKGPRGDLSNWTPQHLVFGDEWREGTANWDGKLEGVAIYDRPLSLAEAREHHAAFLEKIQGRKPVEQVVVTARLLATTPPPAPASIAPYRRALVVNDYEVEKVLAGHLADKKFQATHWGVLDARVLPSNWKVGSVYQLTLEKFSEQPQMEGERVISDSSDFGLDLFLAVATGPPSER